MTDVVCVSDLHGHLPEIPPCRLLLIGGDICPVLDHGLYYQARWLNTDFRKWLESVPAEKIVGVAGNHDLVFQERPETVSADLPWTYLQDSGTEWEGLKIWGSPWQPVFHDWAFNAAPETRRDKWAAIPEDTDILLLHGPPHGYGDEVPARAWTNEEKWPEPEHAGCKFLAERIAALPRLKLVVFGHIHEGRGKYLLDCDDAFDPLLVNASLVDGRYRAVHKPCPIRMSRYETGEVWFS